MMYQQAYDLTIIGALLITIGMMGLFLVAQCAAIDAMKQNLHVAHTMLKLAEANTKQPYYSGLQKLKEKHVRATDATRSFLPPTTTYHDDDGHHPKDA